MLNGETNSSTNIGRKNDVRTLLKQETRRIVRLVRAAGVGNDELRSIGLRPRRQSRTASKAPESAPAARIIATEGRTVTVRLKNANSLRRARPASAIGAQVFLFAGEQAPEDVGRWGVGYLTSRTKLKVDVGPEVPPGSLVWVAARWISPRLELGPVSRMVCRRIPGDRLVSKRALKLAA